MNSAWPNCSGPKSAASGRRRDRDGGAARLDGDERRGPRWRFVYYDYHDHGPPHHHDYHDHVDNHDHHHDGAVIDNYDVDALMP